MRVHVDISLAKKKCSKHAYKIFGNKDKINAKVFLLLTIVHDIKMLLITTGVLPIVHNGIRFGIILTVVN